MATYEITATTLVCANCKSDAAMVEYRCPNQKEYCVDCCGCDDNYGVLWGEDLERIAKSLNLEHPDYERLQFYVSNVRSNNVDSACEYAKNNLAKWIEDEQECFYGTFESTAHFVKHYLEYFDTDARIPDYVKVDYDETWNHHFYGWVFEEPYGYVWADIF